MGNSNEQVKKEQKIDEIVFFRNSRGFLTWQIKMVEITRPEELIFLEEIKEALNNIVNKDIARKKSMEKKFKDKKVKDKTKIKQEVKKE